MSSVGPTVAGIAVFVTFPAFLIAGAICDFRTRRIPNLVTSLFALVGLVVCASGTGPASLRTGCLAGGISLVIGMAMHAMRVMGGGDVKLFAAAALWLGPAATLTAALATAIAGGVAALYYLRRPASRRALGRPSSVLDRLRLDDGPDDDRVPYGVAIAAGSLWAWWPQIRPLLGAA
jgi:prepilin peptidase CpaA